MPRKKAAAATPAYRMLEVTVRDGVGVLALNRPEVRNAFDETLIAEVTLALHAFEGDPDVRAVVVVGRGKSFCAGADLAWMKRMAGYDEATNVADAQNLALMLRTLANLDPPPESVPINTLVPVAGTPLEHMPPVDPFDLVRMIGTARILMPASRVRLSAGRLSLSREAQILCMLAGANSIFYGEKLLTTGNPDVAADQSLLAQAGYKVMEVVETSEHA